MGLCGCWIYAKPKLKAGEYELTFFLKHNLFFFESDIMSGPTIQYSLENVEAVLHQFYHDVQSQVQANHFLMMAQLSPEAWNFAWQLLHPSKPQEVQFFGASTLQVKISKHWHEIPSDQYGVLREKLLGAVISYASGPSVILTRLCVALSWYIFQTVTDFWPTAISDLMSAFQPQNVPTVKPEQATHVLLKLLTVLNEELQTAHMSSSKVGSIRNALQISFEPVMNLVEKILLQSKTTASSSSDLTEMALKCYSSWSQLGSAVLEKESLLLLIFDAVYKEDLCQTALETLSNIALHCTAHKYPNFILKMIENIVKLEGLLSKAIAEEDTDTCSSIYAVAIAVAEHHSNMLLDLILQKPDKRDVILQLISFILRCSGSPGQYPVDEICSEQAFGFWYNLQDAIKASEPSKFESLLLVFHPVFQSLVDTYLVKVRFPPDEVFNQWNSDEKEAFRCYRQDIGDSCMYCYNILREAMLANLMAHLCIATTAAISDSSNWQYLEACLFAFKEVSESVDVEENHYIPQFMSHLPNIPLQHLRVISASMEAIGAYADWINSHPEVMGCVMPLLLMGLQNADVAPSASFALKDITRDCYDCLQPYAEQILITSETALKGNILKSRERVRLMTTVGQVLSIMPFDYTMSFLNSLLTPMITQLQQLISQESPKKNSAMVVLYLHMMSTLFATLDIRRREKNRDHDEGKESTVPKEKSHEAPQPIFFVLQNVLPIFTAIGTHYEINEQITEALCEALKRAVSTLLGDCKDLVPDILHLIMHLYKHCPHYTVLDMAKQMLMIFADDENQRPQLSSFFAEICNHTLDLTQKGKSENFSKEKELL